MIKYTEDEIRYAANEHISLMAHKHTEESLSLGKCYKKKRILIFHQRIHARMQWNWFLHALQIKTQSGVVTMQCSLPTPKHTEFHLPSYCASKHLSQRNVNMHTNTYS